MNKQWTPEEEREIADSASAVLVNRFWLESFPDGSVRLMFMERSSSGRRQYPRCAVIMTAGTAHELSDAIRRYVPPTRGGSAFLELAATGRKN